MSEATPPILLDRDGAVAHLRFNRPGALNAIDSATARQLQAHARTLAADPSVRAIVLSGTGRGFVAGGDLPEMRGHPEVIGREIIEPLHAAILTLTSGDAPVIASVHGVVAGAGVSLMLAADFAIAAEDARLSFAYLGIGTSCDGGASFLLPRVVGLRRALEIAILNEALSAADAARLELVNRVVPVESLAAETAALATRLSQGPTRVIGRMRRLMRGSFENTLAAQLDAERAAFEACAAEPDFSEGLSAFFDKRAPRFGGRAS